MQKQALESLAQVAMIWVWDVECPDSSLSEDQHWPGPMVFCMDSRFIFARECNVATQNILNFEMFCPFTENARSSFSPSEVDARIDGSSKISSSCNQGASLFCS